MPPGTKLAQPTKVWDKCLADIKKEVGSKAFHLWFEPLQAIDIKDGRILVLQVPTEYFSDWIEQHYLPVLRKVLTRHLSPKAGLEYAIVKNGVGFHPASGTTNPPSLLDRIGCGQPVTPPQSIPAASTHLNPSLTFQNFVKGEANQMALQAAKEIARKGFHESFNPLFIYGPSGVGKTHLVHALGNELLRRHPKRRIYYVTAEEFSVQYIDAVIKHKNYPTFLRFYESLNVLIIDDIQTLMGKEKTQYTFFTIFDFLYQNRQQIIVTSDRRPTELQGMMDRLVSRFRIGLLAEIHRPDYEMRLGILRQKASEEGLDLPEEYYAYIAEHVEGNARALQGVLVSLLAHSMHLQQPITIDLVRSVIDRYRESTVKEVSIREIINVAAEYFNVDPEDILSSSRKQPVVRARQVAMYVVRNFTNIPLDRIGKEFGNKDHSTVIYACRKVNEMLKTDRRLKDIVDQIKKKVAD